MQYFTQAPDGNVLPFKFEKEVAFACLLFFLSFKTEIHSLSGHYIRGGCDARPDKNISILNKNKELKKVNKSVIIVRGSGVQRPDKHDIHIVY